MYHLDDDMRPIERFMLTDNKDKAPIPDLKYNSYNETYKLSADIPSTLDKITNGYHEVNLDIK